MRVCAIVCLHTFGIHTTLLPACSLGSAKTDSKLTSHLAHPRHVWSVELARARLPITTTTCGMRLYVHPVARLLSR